MSDDLVERLRNGIIEHAKRWSGDTHADLGGSVDYNATGNLMAEAAARIAELEAEVARLRDAVDFLRTTIRKNIVVKPGPHTVALPDGTVHGGPLADYMHELLPMIADVLDRAALGVTSAE